MCKEILNGTMEESILVMYIKTREFGYYRNLTKFPSQKLDKVSRDLDLLKGQNVFFFFTFCFVCLLF